MSDHQNLQITVTVLAGIAVSCAALYWHSNNAQPPRDVPHPTAIEPAESPPAAFLAAPPPASESRLAIRPAPKPKTDDAPTDNYVGADLPVVFAFSERTVYTTEEKTDGEPVNVTRKVKEGIISNTSGQLLTITATEVNIPTQESSSAQISLPPGTQKHFGTDQGLKMISGDEITLRSPSYRNFVQMIP